jgi:hypothetical protein
MRRRAFAQTLKSTREELERLRRERARIDTELAKLEQVETALQAVAEPRQEKAVDLSSITDVVRNVLKSAIVPITPPEVRDKMVAMGFDKGPYSQFLASIHVVLKRLWKNGEAFEFTFDDKKTYWWVTKSMPAGSHPENLMLGKYYNTRRPEDLKTSKSQAESHYKAKA